MSNWGRVPNKRNTVSRGADSTLTTAWNMGGRLLDLPPWHLDLVAAHIAQLPLSQWQDGLAEAQEQIDPRVLKRKREEEA